MHSQHKQPCGSCPVSIESVRAEVRAAFDDLEQSCLSSECSFWRFEKQLFVLMAALGVRLIRLFLTAPPRADARRYSAALASAILVITLLALNASAIYLRQRAQRHMKWQALDDALN